MEERVFSDRAEAGRALNEHLHTYADRDDVVVLALPRGGVPVGYEVARALNAPLDVYIVQKLGVPGHEEMAMGAIASGGVRVMNASVVDELRIDQETIDSVTDKERRELERREQAYRPDRPRIDLHGKTVIVVDDGLATGATMRSALAAIREADPQAVIVAVPVCPAQTIAEFQNDADEFICLMTPKHFGGVGRWYLSFDQTTDDEVRDLLRRAGID